MTNDILNYADDFVNGYFGINVENYANIERSNSLRPKAWGERGAPEGGPSSDPEYEELIRLHAELFDKASYCKAALEWEEECAKLSGVVNHVVLDEKKKKYGEADERTHHVHTQLREKGASLGKSPLEIAGDVLISIIRLMPAFEEKIWPSYTYALIRSGSPDTAFSIYGGFYAYELDARKDILLAFYNKFWNIHSHLYSSGSLPPETRHFKSEAEKALKEVDRFIDFLRRNKPAILPFIKIVDYKDSHRHEDAPNIFGVFVVGIAFPVENLEEVLSVLKEFLVEKAGDRTILPAKPDASQEALLSSI